MQNDYLNINIKSATDASISNKIREKKPIEGQFIINFDGKRTVNYEKAMNELSEYFENIDKQPKIRKSIYIQENHYKNNKKNLDNN